MEVPLQAQVVLRGLVRLQLLVAALTVPAQFAGTTGQATIIDIFLAEIVQAAGRGDVAVARARDHLRRGTAQHKVVGQVVRDVEARQYVGVGTIERGNRERLGVLHAVRELPVAFAAALGADRRAGRGRAGIAEHAGQRIAIGTVEEVVVVGRDLVRRVGVLPGARDAHADVAAQAVGAEVGLQVGGVDLLVDVVDEVVLLAGLHRAVGAVEVGDIAREVDRRERAGADAARQVAQRGDQARRELAGEIAAAAIPVAVIVVARIRARAHPVAVAGAAVDAAVADLDAELQRFEHVAVEVPGTVDLAVLLPGVVAGPGRTRRAGVDLQDAVLQVLQQLRRERHRRRAGQIPRAGVVAVRPAAVRILPPRLDRQRELQLGPALGPRAADLERHVQLLAAPLAAEVDGLRKRLLDVVAAGDLRRRHGAVVRTPAARCHAGGGGLFLTAVVGLARVQAVVRAGDDGAAGIEGQPVQQATAPPVAVAMVARDVPLRDLQRIGLRILRQVEAEVVRGQGQVVGRLELEGQLPALALALFFLDVEVDRRRHHEAGVVVAVLVPEAGTAPPVGVEVRGLAVDVDRGAAFVAPVPLPAFGAGPHGAHGALLLGVADEDAEPVLLVVPGVRAGDLSIRLLGGVRPGAFDIDEAGVGLQFERTTRMQDDRAADAALVDARFRRLEQLGAAQHVRRQQCVVERTGRVAVGFGTGDVVAVQLGQHQLRGQATHADVLALTAIAADEHARHALQRIRDVLVGELAYILRGDHFHHGVRVALLLEALLDRVAVALDRHRVQVRGLHLGLARRGGRAVRLLGERITGCDGRGQRDGDPQIQRAAVACVWRAFHFNHPLPRLISCWRDGFVSI